MSYLDDRDVDEIKADGDELSLLQNYNFNEVSLSEPGMPDERSVLRDYSDAPDDGYDVAPETPDDPGGGNHYYYSLHEGDEEEQPDEPFIVGGIEFPSQAAAEEWAEAWQAEQQGRQLSPEQAALGVIDARVADSFAQLQQAQLYAEQGRAERAYELDRRAELDEQGAYEEAIPEVQAICEWVGLEKAVPSEWVLERAEEIAELTKAWALAQGMASATEIDAAAYDQEFARSAVQQAAEEFRDKLISERALSRI
jgi:hypothetical protein